MDESYLKQLNEQFTKSDRSRETEVLMYGDTSTIAEIVSLLTLIRNAINSDKPYDINVEIGKTVNRGKFDFTVNGVRTEDFKAIPEAHIN